MSDPRPEPPASRSGGQARLLTWPAAGEAAHGHRRAVLALLVGFGMLYGLTASRAIQGGDSGELMTVAVRGGVAHPPGYPLYSLLSHLFAWLPFDPALSVSLCSVVCALAALVVLYRALLRWRLGHAAALIATCILGVSPSFWRYTGVPEVFTLGTLMMALLLWAAGRQGHPRGMARAAALGLVFGLGLANQQTIVLGLPLVVLGLYRALQERPRHRVLTVPLPFLAGLAVGLLPYVSLLGASHTSGWTWGGALDWNGLVDHFLRRSFGTFSLGISDMRPSLLENTGAYLLHLGRGFSALALLGLWGIALAAASLRRPRSPGGPDAAALLLAFLLAAVVFFGLVNLRPVSLAASVIERFYLLPDLLFAGLCAVGVQHILSRRPRIAIYVHSFAVGVLCLLVVAHVDAADWSDDYAVEDYLLNALDTVEPNSVIVGTGDLQLFGFLATNEVLAYRTDVHYVDLSLLRTRWYYDRVRAELPDLTAPFDAAHTPVVEVVADLMAHHSVYVADIGVPLPALDRRLVPIGPLFLVEPFGHPMPSPAQVEQMNVTALHRLQFRGRAPRDPNGWGACAFSYYARTWDLLADAYQRDGDDARAARARAMAQPFHVPSGDSR